MEIKMKPAKPCWRKINKNELYRAEAYLKKRENLCVAACARFLNLRESRGHVWRLAGPEADIASLIIHSQRTLFPVFGEKKHIPVPRFLNRFLGRVPIHALQGLCDDTELLETIMESQGYFAAERNDYFLMSLDYAPELDALKSGPAGLVLRPPLPEDEEYLFALQAAYEQEEVLPANKVFNPSASRLGLRQILSRERVLVAVLDCQVAGKINTSAQSFTRYQIGGVYVRPDCRGLGIGLKMTAVFTRKLLSLGKGITLFVKRNNAAACKVYRRAGFNVLADYRITYY